MTLVALFVATITAYSCQQPQQDRTASSQQQDTLQTDTTTHRLSLLFAGDLMQHGPQIKAAHRPDGSYDYTECFERIKPEVERADVAIANFEGTLAGEPYTGYPQFSAPDDYLRGVIDAGFDVLTTANNHCLDGRRRGLERTIMMMDSLGVPHLGTYINKEARRADYPFLLERNGLRVVLLSFTYGTNGIPLTPPNVVNYMDTTEIVLDLVKARLLEPDVIIAMPHWGIEYQTLPSAEQRAMAQWLIRHGVDHVIGGHPHVAQPIELSDDGRHLVAWSMGNVVSNQSKPNTYGGYMVRIELEKRDSVTTLSDCGYTLYWVSRPPDNGYRHNYRILPIDEPDSVLTATERNLRQQISTSMRKLMERHAKGVKEYGF